MQDLLWVRVLQLWGEVQVRSRETLAGQNTSQPRTTKKKMYWILGKRLLYVWSKMSIRTQLIINHNETIHTNSICISKKPIKIAIKIIKIVEIAMIHLYFFSHFYTLLLYKHQKIILHIIKSNFQWVLSYI